MEPVAHAPRVAEQPVKRFDLRSSERFGSASLDDRHGRDHTPEAPWRNDCFAES